MSTHERPRTPTRVAVDAQALGDLYSAPAILRVVNVWDAASARVVAELPGTTAIATAGHGIAASHGYPDGEQIPLALMLDSIDRISRAAEHLPITADLDGGYGDVGETVRRAIGVGASGANIEDRMRPFAESVTLMHHAVAAGADEGVAFALNARTDALIADSSVPRADALSEAVRRGRAYIEAGATCVFVPGVLTADETRTLVSGIGDRLVSVIGLPGALTAAEYEALGVARISYGPMPQNVALTALKRLGASLYGDGVIPGDTEQLNNF
ncbi:isocitrate lyase/PEP mutase family protein [Leucobacter luti]|uniref:2-methylisocitrate lyase-like PEP mutase family enzyme n=1 Tax=Leucobacter luti TaxID=340320 RepID=A0A4Q7TK60_9MICO|nr:isocitrate lyase/phosphoenolpyruvate mutase family protein [Leucobacter luti]MBL3700281.1 isocitrate lyase/phosphoenolpyruvate mutase family protein [Leucobacter luti]RZT60995.1 2-methylisocitrate lyase-like PEP mutase family enzyme [Leucobacter luti]